MTPYYDEGGIVIYHADCREVLPTLAPVDHVITDPPYARDVYLRAASVTSTDKGYSDKELRRRGVSLHKMGAGDIGSIDEMLEAVAVEVARLAKRWAVVFSDAETTWRWRAALETAGLRYIRTGAWVKPNAMPQMSGDRPAVGFEPATICHAQGPMRWNGGGHQAVWTYGTASQRERVCVGDGDPHPCPKPEALMCELIALFTDPGELILDPFCGSGTTGVAAKKLNRRAILIEQDERYCELTAHRIQQTLQMWEPASAGDAVDPHLSARGTDAGPRATETDLLSDLAGHGI